MDDDFVDSVCSADTKDRIDVGEKLIARLKATDEVEEGHATSLSEHLGTWLKGSNIKANMVALNALELLVERAGAKFRGCVVELVPILVEKLGDGKDQIRDGALDILKAIINYDASSPMHVLEIASPGFKHKNWKVKQSLLTFVEQALNLHGAGSVGVSKLIVPICKLVTDQNESVRESAQVALVEMYRHVGERVRSDIAKKGEIPAAKQTALFERFDAVKHSGTMLVTLGNDLPEPRSRSDSLESSSSSLSNSQSSNQMLSLRKSRDKDPSVKEPSRAPKPPTNGLTAPRKISGPPTKNVSIDIDEFEQAMNDAPPLSIRESELASEMHLIAEMVGDDRKYDWEKRIEMLKKLRGYVAGGCTSYSSFPPVFKSMADGMCNGIKDLRSAVSREACITIALIATQMRQSFEPYSDMFVAVLLKQVVINVKIIADSSHLAMVYLVKATQSVRILQRLIEYKDSKAVAQRRRVAEYVHLALQEWDGSFFGKHVALVGGYLTHSLNEADSVVRSTARRAYWVFQSYYPDHAASIMQSLDPSKQKLLLEERDKAGDSAATTPTSSTTPTLPSTHAPSLRASKTSQRPGTGPPKPVASLFEEETPQTWQSGSMEDLTKHSIPQRVAHPPRESSLDTHTQPRTLIRDESTKPRSILATKTSILTASDKTKKATKPVLTASPTPVSVPRKTAPSRTTAPPPRESPTSAASFHEVFHEVQSMGASPDDARRRVAQATLLTLLKTMRPPVKEVPQLLDFFVRQISEHNMDVLAGVVACMAEFAASYKDLCTDEWVMEVLSHLIVRHSADLSPSVLAQVGILFEIFRDSFPPVPQLVILNRLLAAPLPNIPLSIKLAEMEYYAYLLPSVQGEDLDRARRHNPDEYRDALLRIIVYSGDSQSVDVRKLSTHVLVTMVQINRDLFQSILSALDPVTVESTHKLIEHSLRNLHEGGLEPRGSIMFDDFGSTDDLDNASDAHLYSGSDDSRPTSPSRDIDDTLVTDPSTPHAVGHYTSPRGSTTHLPVAVHRSGSLNNIQPLASLNRDSNNKTSTPNLFHRQETEPHLASHYQGDSSHIPVFDPHKYSHSSSNQSLHLYQDPGSTPRVQGSPARPRSSSGSDVPSHTSPVPLRDQPLSPSKSLNGSNRDYNPSTYQEQSKRTSAPSPGSKIPTPTQQRKGMTYSPSATPPPPFASTQDPMGAAIDLLQGGSSQMTQTDTEATLHWLVRVSRENVQSVWVKQIDSVVHVVLAMLNDPESSIRELTLRVLREIIKNQFSLLEKYIPAIIAKVLERNKDTERGTLRAVDEIITLISSSIDPLTCIDILNPIVSNEDGPVLLGALKLLTKILRRITKDELLVQMDSLLPGLIKGYKHPLAEVRKGVVFAFVELHEHLGDGLNPFLSSLSASQVKLLQIYIKRAEENKAEREDSTV